MILERFFKPKWQHPDPEVRIQALQGLSVSDPVLIQAAREDQNPGVRRAILHRLADLKLLQELALHDPEIGVRETAEARFRKLMTGREPDSPDLETRLTVLAQSTSPALGEFLAIHGAEPRLRMAALEKFKRDSLFGDIAINDPTAEVRLAALEQVNEEFTLKRIAKQTLKRDKRLNRRARERLEALQGERERAARSEQLCAELEALAKDLAREPDAGRFQRLEQDWETQASAAAPPIQERYRQAREQFLSRLHEGAARRRQRLELGQSLEGLLARLRAETELSPELAATIQNTLQAFDREQPQAAVSTAGEDRHLFELVQGIRDRERILQRNHQRAERLRQFLQEADVLLHQASEVQERDLSDLKKRWGSLERPEASNLVANLQAQFDAALDRLHARLRRQAEQKDQELEALEGLVSGVEEALTQGALQQAIALHDQARQRLKHNISLSRKQMMAFGNRLQACTPKMGELRGWRRWGTNQARENICEDMEGLIGSAKDPLEIARQIKQARAAWKTLDSTEGVAPRPLWERFNGACERAYEPCRVYFEAKAQERQENLKKKQAVCEELGQFETNTDWDHADWHAVERFRREVQNRWRKIGPVNRADKKALEQRYQKALQRLDAHLDQERERDLCRRQGLIRRVQDLTHSEDLRAAIESAKKAQAEWPPTVQASRRKEQELWREFRAACDSLFERRDAERQAADTERQANLAHKSALCEEIEALAPADEETTGRARNRVQEIRRQWASGGTVPKTAYKQIEQRFAQAIEQFERRCQNQRQAREREELRVLRDKARLCARIETLLATAPSAEAALVEQVRQEWESLPALKKPLEEPIRRRFEIANQAAAEDGGARQSLLKTLEANLEHKQALCLRMEILAGVETPAEFARERMEYQVARLSESMVEPHSVRIELAAAEEAREIERNWYLTGATPSDLNEILESRFQRAIAAFYQHQE